MYDIIYTERKREVNEMTEIRKIIKEAEAKGNEVIISDGWSTMERVGDYWSVCSEMGWFYSEEEIDKRVVIRVEEDGKLTDIIVEDLGW